MSQYTLKSAKKCKKKIVKSLLFTQKNSRKNAIWCENSIFVVSNCTFFANYYFQIIKKNLICFAGGLILFGIYLPFLWFCNLKPFEVRLPRTWWFLVHCIVIGRYTKSYHFGSICFGLIWTQRCKPNCCKGDVCSCSFFTHRHFW